MTLAIARRRVPHHERTLREKAKGVDEDKPPRRVGPFRSSSAAGKVLGRVRHHDTVYNLFLPLRRSFFAEFRGAIDVIVFSSCFTFQVFVYVELPWRRHAGEGLQMLKE